MKIVQKLILGFATVALLAGVVGYVGLMTFRNVGETFSELKGDIVPGAIKMTEMQVYADKIHLHLAEYIAGDEVELNEEIETALQKLLRSGKEYLMHETNINNERKEDAEKFMREIGKLNFLVTQVVDARKQQLKIKEKLDLVVGVLALQIKERKSTYIQELTALNEMQELSAKIGYLTTVYVMKGLEEERKDDEEIKGELRTTQQDLVRVGNTYLEREISIGSEEKRSAEELNAKIATLSSTSDELINLKDKELTLGEEFYPEYKILIGHLTNRKEKYMQELDDVTVAVSQAQDTSTNIIIIISLIIIVLAIVIGFLISRAIAVPIIRLKDAAVEIGKGNLDSEVKIKSNDEIGILGDSFNKMVADLKVSRIKLESYSKELEEQVRQRTEELEDSKVDLEKTVGERTKELKARLEELERFRKATIDREFRIKELQEEITTLKAQKKK